MDKTNYVIAEQVARAVRNFQQRRTGHAPTSVTVVEAWNGSRRAVIGDTAGSPATWLGRTRPFNEM